MRWPAHDLSNAWPRWTGDREVLPSPDGRCAKCGGSGFSYDGFQRGYVCMSCGTIKPEQGADMPKKQKYKFRIGDIALPRRFIVGTPVGASVDTRLVVRERAPGDLRYRCERDDGRQGSWWIDEDDLRRLGES